MNWLQFTVQHMVASVIGCATFKRDQIRNVLYHTNLRMVPTLVDTNRAVLVFCEIAATRAAVNRLRRILHRGD